MPDNVATPLATSVFAICPQCDWKYQIPGEDATRRCPHCFRVELEPLAEETASGSNQEASLLVQATDSSFPPTALNPELIIPVALSSSTVAERVRLFSTGIPFSPADLTPQNLLARLQTVYLPVYLVDVTVESEWSMEAGFNYEVVSHQERFSDGSGGWKTREVKETRVRWEPRLGRLSRTYQNLPAPALEQPASLRRNLGEFDLSAAQPFEPGKTLGAWMRLPDRSLQDAWPDAIPGLQSKAAGECQQATGADYSRDFRWAPVYSQPTWTLLLEPVFSSYYLDDENQPQPVWINGQSGAVSGVRRASTRRAQRTTWIALAVAVSLFVLSILLGVLGIVVPVLLPVAAIGIILAVVIALGALVPLYTVWSFNRKG